MGLHVSLPLQTTRLAEHKGVNHMQDSRRGRYDDDRDRRSPRRGSPPRRRAPAAVSSPELRSHSYIWGSKERQTDQGWRKGKEEKKKE